MRFGGTIDKIIGDSIMVFFGDPESRGINNDALSCVSMALATRKSMTKLKNRWQAVGIENQPLSGWESIAAYVRSVTLVLNTT